MSATAAWSCSARMRASALGELSALRRRHIDFLHGRINVVEAAGELRDGSRVVGPPKTAAGRRIVAIPPQVLADVEEHMAKFVDADPDALVFKGAARHAGAR